MKTGTISKILLFNAAMVTFACSTKEKKVQQRPNFLILMSDNQCWNHLGCYGDPVLKTPAIDQLAKEGIRFTRAYCSAPSCSPARASMLTGQDIWRLEQAANLWSDFPPQLTVFTDLLEQSGYLVGYEGKGWGPGDWKGAGRQKDPSGKKFNSFEEFFNEVKKGQPFLYWFSSRDPHRPYKENGWEKFTDRLDKIEVPPYLPDNDEVRKDIADYYGEIENFDNDVSSYIQLLKEVGQLENTLILVCSDNGWQMPRGLANLYDFGMHIPFILSMPQRFQGNRVVGDFISLNDVAPTFLDLAGIKIPSEVTARSLVPILESGKQGIVDASRTFVVGARERHAFVRKNGEGYGSRSYCNKDYLYIRNYEPDKWPAGDPPLYGDVDAHMLHYPCATKMFMLVNKDREGVKDLFDLGFSKRPAEELYDLNKDPWQLKNVAYQAEYKPIRDQLSASLTRYLTDNKDPRETGGEMKWINAPYYAEKDKRPKPGEEARRLLNLKEEYSYLENQ